MKKKSFKEANQMPKKNVDLSKDFLDYLEDDAADKKPKEVTDQKRDRRLNEPVKNEQVSTLSEPVVNKEDQEERDVRQTFIIGNKYLETLKDLVYTKRIQGEYNYSQKDALHAGLDKLFAKEEIIPRPEELRLKEEARKKKIKRALEK